MIIRPLNKTDFVEWQPLFEGYCTFYEVPVTEEKTKTVWSWLMDPGHYFRGIVAAEGGHLVGLAHFHGWADCLDGRDLCYLSDLFVEVPARGKQVGKKLLEEVLSIAKGEGWKTVTLLTANTNEVGQKLYDQYGAPIPYKFYALDTANA